MKLNLRSRKSLKYFVAISWAIPGTIAIVVSLLAFFIVGRNDHRDKVSRIVDELQPKALVAARRLAGEVALGKNGAPSAVARVLEQELRLASVEVTQSLPPCFDSKYPSSVTCASHKGNSIQFYEKLPFVQGVYFVSISTLCPTYLNSLNLKLLLWSGLPVFFILGLGIFLQRRFLNSFVLQPVESLIDYAVKTTPVPSYWPQELADISEKLSRSFEDRDRAVFGQLASGVIHDIKTLLHSLLSAMALVSEQSLDPEKRRTRLENLFQNTLVNLPKMKKIIDLTLDGSREIPISFETENIYSTIENSIEINKELAALNRVEIIFEKPTDSLFLAHDPVQLERAFSNLIKNGVEAVTLRSQGEPLNSSRLVKISAIESKHKIVAISIEDSGAGLKIGKDQIFRPVRSTKSDGAGLGLYVTRKIIQAHGGNIGAEPSSVFSGAKFSVTLNREARTEMAP